MTTYIFPGQGSQHKGMGRELFPKFQDFVKKSDSILDYSIEKLCLEDPDEKLNNTDYTQPALFVTNALTYYTKIQNHKKPDYVAGHSLGEYNALLAAGVFDFETGLKLVQKRGALMSQAIGGGMAAIVGPSYVEVTAILEKNNLPNVAIANLNSLTQNVISGSKKDIETTAQFFQFNGTMFIPLKVSGAFHSPYMEGARKEYANFLQQFHFNAPTIPVIANVNGAPYSANQVAENLALQITHSVQWTKSIQYLLERGESEFIESGPGSVLTGLVRRIKNGQ